MKLFLDTAIMEDIIPRYETGLIAGITTNPTLVRNSGVDYHGFIATCCEAFPALESVSAEVSGETAEEMIEEAATYLTLGSAVTIKVPLNKEGLIDLIVGCQGQKAPVKQSGGRLMKEYRKRGYGWGFSF
mgnify:CR=1 FL=1